MKPRLPLLCLVFWGSLGAADEVASPPSMRATLSAEIRKHVAYVAPAPAKPAAEPSAPDDDVVVFEPFKVVTRLDAFAHKIEEKEQQVLNEQFTFKKGGTFAKIEGRHVTTEFEFWFNPEHGAWDLLRFSW